MTAVFYHLLAYPFSLLPLRVLYLFSDFFFLLLITIVPYRKKVIERNLRNSFPEKSEGELRALKRKFYRHFSDLLAEGIKNLSISEKELRKRLRVVNPELIEKLYAENKNVLLVSGHYNNWEWLICAQNFLLPHQAVGIGMPLSSKFWDKKLNERRARFGMHIINAKHVKDFFNQDFEKPIATLILSDQSPGDSHKAYWMEFLHQPTAVLFGCELLAHTHNHAVVFFIMRKIGRGRYAIEFQSITDQPADMKWGEITEKHTQLLEQEIRNNPQYWIWSHKRWKRQVPDDLPALRSQQEKSFYEKFKN